MYKYFRLVTLTLNIEGGASETIEKMTKEVNKEVVPCTTEEALLKMFNKISSVGGNPATQTIKVLLLDDNGGVIKVEEVTKEVA